MLKSACAQILRKDDNSFDYKSMHKHKVFVALFWFTHFSHDYNFVIKEISVDFEYFSHEEKIYWSLWFIQNKYVFICLRSVNIFSYLLYYNNIARINYLLFLSHAERFIRSHENSNISQSIREILLNIHDLEIQHRDAHDNNIFWNVKNKDMMIIDFNRARISFQKYLPSKSASRKRKRDDTIFSCYLSNTQQAAF